LRSLSSVWGAIVFSYKDSLESVLKASWQRIFTTVGYRHEGSKEADETNDLSASSFSSA
jgi:hypothetical protein